MVLPTVSEKENRRIPRISISLPVKVEVRVDLKTSYDEITRMKDVSAFGTGLTLSRPLKRGRLVFLTIPMPRKLRCFDFAEPQYRIWGIVRRCIKMSEASSNGDRYAIGIGFIGKYPPDSYVNNPSNIYDISNRADKGFWNLVAADENPEEFQLEKNVRRHSRFRIPAGILLETMDDSGNTVSTEQTVTENISVSGAAIFTAQASEIGAFVRIRSDQYDVSIISIVRGCRIGTDGITRIHVEFIDRFFPLEGIE